MEKYSKLRNLGNWIKPILKHPIRSSLMIGGILLPLNLTNINASINASENNTKIYSKSTATNVHLDGATLSTYFHVLYKGEKGPAPLSDGLFTTNDDSTNIRYMVVKDPVKYLKRVVDNKENPAGTRGVAEDVLNLGVVGDSVSVSNLQKALDDGYIYGDELKGVKTGLYPINVLTSNWEFNSKGSSIIMYVDVKEGERPGHSASEISPTLFSGVSRDSLERRMGKKGVLKDERDILRVKQAVEFGVYINYFPEHGFVYGISLPLPFIEPVRFNFGIGFGKTESLPEESSSLEFISGNTAEHSVTGEKYIDLGEFGLSYPINLSKRFILEPCIGISGVREKTSRTIVDKIVSPEGYVLDQDVDNESSDVTKGEFRGYVEGIYKIKNFGIGGNVGIRGDKIVYGAELRFKIPRKR